ncbi:hypothetical protein [Chromobacterium vaccinii]|uniref:hypothetical protein n=1 Tax=Chromobacterium vaccinii TaxID=1108595 RepID=UPI000E1276E0|nr:hypothetical protein [Chromobacterium vaccinii]SUX53567.1 Uncharacterised protein [Chromobacterium vaccinii]
MPARLSELCKQTPLELQVNEAFLAEKNRDIPSCLQCQQDIFIGFFFDGTNNNKTR